MSVRAAVGGALALVALLVAVPSASAARGLEVGIGDDRILFGDAVVAERTAARWKAAGIDTVRLFARWVAIAPRPHSTRAPRGFVAGDPADPRYSWAALDRAIGILLAHGLRPMVVVTGSGPLWGSSEPERGNPRWKPHPRRFAQFAKAVARRYAPVVDRYLIWNEPNHPGWLQPQADCVPRERPPAAPCRPVAPHLYRELVRAAYPEIKAADPDSRVLIGQLASGGGDLTRRNAPIEPMPFLRAMACVDRRLRPLHDGRCARFRPAHGDAIGHHAHPIRMGPAAPSPDPDDARIGDLDRLVALLDRLDAAGRLVAVAGRFQIYLTEFGYQTRPPDRALGVSLAAQARYLQQAAEIAWRHPRVRNLTQYEWRDEPVRNLGAGRRRYAGWQSGLLFEDGRPKPAFHVFSHPFVARMSRSGLVARFWGQVRRGASHLVVLERRLPDESGWRSMRTIRTDATGYWTARHPMSGAAWYRFRYGHVTGASKDPADEPGQSAPLLLEPTARGAVTSSTPG